MTKKMTKKVRCPKCHGRGYIVPRVHGGMVVSKSCDHCNGKGMVDVPMTNADSIRAMSDEELAKWFADMWDCSYCSEDERLGGNPLLRGEQCDCKCDQHCLEWLKQPVEEV